MDQDFSNFVSIIKNMKKKTTYFGIGFKNKKSKIQVVLFGVRIIFILYFSVRTDKENCTSKKEI